MAGSLIVLAFGGFIALGMGDGVLGVAWPSIAEGFDRDLGELGLLITVGTVGYLLGSLGSGRVERAVGMGRMLVVSAGVSAVGLAGFATAPGWALALVATFVVWTGAALVDAGLNAYVAVRHSVRVMHFLHAAFGVGATIGPVLMGLAIGIGGGWRSGFAVMAAVQVLLVAGFLRSKDRWGGAAGPSGARDPRERRPPALLLVVAVFLAYTGVEVAAGQWSFTVLTVDRGLSDGVGSALVAGYWGSLTAGRVVIGGLGDRLSPRTSLIGGAWISVAGLVLFWLEAGPWAGGTGLLVAGLGFAPVFPSLVALTPVRVGADRTSGAVGYQLAAAGAGAIAVPGAIGLLVEAIGLGTVAPVLAGAAAVMAATTVAVSRRGSVPGDSLPQPRDRR